MANKKFATTSEKMLGLMYVSRELLARNGKEVPMWFFGNPGCAKSETVKLFAEIMGYEYLDLEANSRTEEDIKGFISTPTEIKAGECFSAATIKPDWLDVVERNTKAGKKTLIFLDELNTLSPQVAAVLLQLIQKRATRNVALDSNALIVAAGNYFENIDNKQMLPMVTMLNRFCLINLTTGLVDVELSDARYEDLLNGVSDKIKSYKEVYEDRFSETINLLKETQKIDPKDKQKKEDESKLLMGCINKQITVAIKELIEGESNGSKIMDLNEKRIANLYTESPIATGEIYNLLTLRTKDFLVEMAGSFYRCFGIDSLKTELFQDVIKGLAGFGAAYSSIEKDVVFTEIWRKIQSAIYQAVAKFKELFTKSVIGNNNIIITDLENAIKSGNNNNTSKPFYKIDDLNNIESILNRINSEITEDGCTPISTNTLKTLNNVMNSSLPKNKSVKKNNALEYINFYNKCCDIISSVGDIIENKKFTYQSSDINQLSGVIENLRVLGGFLDEMRDNILDSDSTITIPEIKIIY